MTRRKQINPVRYSATSKSGDTEEPGRTDELLLTNNCHDEATTSDDNGVVPTTTTSPIDVNHQPAVTVSERDKANPQPVVVPMVATTNNNHNNKTSNNNNTNNNSLPPIGGTLKRSHATISVVPTTTSQTSTSTKKRPNANRNDNDGVLEDQALDLSVKKPRKTSGGSSSSSVSPTSTSTPIRNNVTKPANNAKTTTTTTSNKISNFSAESLISKSTPTTNSSSSTSKLSNSKNANDRKSSSTSSGQQEKKATDSLDKLFNLVCQVGNEKGGTGSNASSTIVNGVQCTPLLPATSTAALMTSPLANHRVESPTSGGNRPISAQQQQQHTLSPFDLASPLATSAGLSMQELWWKYLKKEESAEMKRMNEAKQIFTCLQCQASFQSMDQLVKHMAQTQHYSNVPKHYSWSLQYARQKMRQMKMKLKYSERMMYFCYLCRSPFNSAVHQHFADVHNMHNPVENMNFVQVITADAQTSANGDGGTSKSTTKATSVSPTPSGGSSKTSELTDNNNRSPQELLLKMQQLAEQSTLLNKTERKSAELPL